jgi:membrane protein DedA with SNARE-associated domain
MHFPELQLLAQHGTLWLFLATLGERLGLPLFVTPLLFAAGTLAAKGQLHIGTLLLVTTAASVAGDTVLYELGRWKGAGLSKLLCKISFLSESSVQKSMAALQRHGGLTLFWAKWMPGVAHLAPPLAGATSMSRQRFHLYNTAGSAAFLAVVLGGGYFSMLTIGWLGLLVITAQWTVAIAFLISSTILVRSFWQRKQALKSLSTAITWRSGRSRKRRRGGRVLILDADADFSDENLSRSSLGRATLEYAEECD